MMANSPVHLSTAQFSILDAAAGRAQRGDLIRKDWDVVLLVGVRKGVPAVAWGLVSPRTHRFLSICERFDHGTPRKKVGGDQRFRVRTNGGR